MKPVKAGGAKDGRKAKLPMVSNLWVFSRGMERHGLAGPRSVEWTSRYGSLIVTGYDISTADGMNKGSQYVFSELPLNNGRRSGNGRVMSFRSPNLVMSSDKRR